MYPETGVENQVIMICVCWKVVNITSVVQEPNDETFFI